MCCNVTKLEEERGGRRKENNSKPTSRNKVQTKEGSVVQEDNKVEVGDLDHLLAQMMNKMCPVTS